MIALIDGNGNEVVEYSYDAWGKPIRKTGTMASTLGTLQPFRYRGYVWDEETGLYYLRSRYYNSVWQKFVNADSLIKGNLFSYSLNNPGVLSDADGKEAALVQEWAATMWWLSAVDGPLPIGDAIYGIGLLATAAAIALSNQQENELSSDYNYYVKKKPVNLPASNKISLDMDHIMSGHSYGGNRGGPKKDRFPPGMTAPLIEKQLEKLINMLKKLTHKEYVFSYRDHGGIEQFKCGLILKHYK